MQCQLATHRVNYEIMGEGKPLVMISGIPSDHRIIRSWMEPIFATRPGWQRIYFDLPGTGLTPAGGITTIEQVLDVVCEFIACLLPDQPFTLLGLSVGGYLARGVAYRMPDRIDGLCLLVPWLSMRENQEESAPAAIVRDAAALAQLDPSDLRLFEGLAVVQNKTVIDWYRTTVKAARQQGEGLPLEQFLFSFKPEDLSKPFPRPALILTGRQDAHVGYREALELSENYPRATVAALDRAGHALGVEHPGLFQALIHEWLDRVEEHSQG